MPKIIVSKEPEVESGISYSTFVNEPSSSTSPAETFSTDITPSPNSIQSETSAKIFTFRPFAHQIFSVESCGSCRQSPDFACEMTTEKEILQESIEPRTYFASELSSEPDGSTTNDQNNWRGKITEGSQEFGQLTSSVENNIQLPYMYDN